MKIKLGVLITTILVSNIVFAQDSLLDPETAKENGTVKPYARNVAGNTYMITGKGGNIGFHVGENEILMIDNQFADATEAILEEIKKTSDKPIKYLINTHHHADHTGGNANMTANGTTIIAHENVRKNMMGIKSKENVTLLPVITFSENMTIYFENEEIFAFHVKNAHTNGDVIIFFPQTNVIHTGDAFVNKTYPFIDEKSGGTLDGYIEGLQKTMLLGGKNTKIIPGHGPVGTMRDVAYTKSMLENLINRVRIEIKRGQTEEEIVANEEITSFYDDQGYGGGFISSEQIRRTIYMFTNETYNKEEKAKKADRELKMKSLEKSNKN